MGALTKGGQAGRKSGEFGDAPSAPPMKLFTPSTIVRRAIYHVVEHFSMHAE